MDFNATSKDRLTVRWRDWYPLTVGYGGTFGTAGNWNFHRQGYTKSEKSLQTTYSRTFGANIVNEASAAFRVMRETAPDSQDDRHLLSAAGIPPFSCSPSANVLGIVPAISFPGVQQGATITYDTRYPIAARDGRYSIVDTLSWSKDRHLFKAGLLYEFNPTSEGPQGTCFQGCFNFSSQTAANINPLNTNQAFANALLGYHNQYQETNLKTEQKAQASIWEWFVQDTWKPVSNLTLDLGVRFGHVEPYRLPDGLIGAAFVPDRLESRACPPAVRAGVRQRRAGRLRSDLRPGRAFDPDRVPRPGFRRLRQRHGHRQGAATTGRPDVHALEAAAQSSARRASGLPMTWAAPAGPRSVAASACSRTCCRRQPIWAATCRDSPRIRASRRSSTDGSPTLPEQPRSIRRSIPSPSTTTNRRPPTRIRSRCSRTWGSRRPSAWRTSAIAISNLRNNLNLNPIAPGARFDPANADPTAPASPLPDNFLRPLIGYGAINLRTNGGYSRYNSLQVTVNRRVRAGLAFGSAYTLAVAKSTSGIPNFHDLAYTYDYAAGDRRHVLSLNGVYDIPSAAWLPRYLRPVLDRWQVAVVAGFTTGAPETVTFTTTDNFDFTGGGDAGRISVTPGCDPILPRGERSHERWFNTSCFIRPAGRGDEGNSSRVHYFGPGLNTWDLTLVKGVKLGGSRQAQLRAEFYNLFNHPTWQTVNNVARFDPAGTQINDAFGTVMPDGSPRIIQLALRFVF